MAFAHQRSNGLAAGPPSHRAAPPKGAPSRMSKQQPGAAADLGLPNIFLQTQEVDGRGLPTATNGGFLTNKGEAALLCQYKHARFSTKLGHRGPVPPSALALAHRRRVTCALWNNQKRAAA